MKKRHTRAWSVLSGALILCILVSFSCAAEPALMPAPTATKVLPQGVTGDTIKIGWHSMLSGPAAYLGVDALNCVKAVAFAVNDAGGIHGRKFEVVEYDDKYDPATAISVAKRLAEMDKVFCAVGMIGTVNSMAGAKVFSEHRLPYMCPAAYSPSLHEPVNKYVYMLQMSGPEYGAAQVEYVFDKEAADKAKKVGYIYLDDDSGQSAAQGAEDKLKELTGSGLLVRAPADRSVTDLSTQILACYREGAEVVCIWSPTHMAISCLKEAQKVNYKPIYFFTEAQATGVVVEAVGKEATEGINVLLINPRVSATDPKTPGGKLMVERVNKYFPDHMAKIGLGGYNAYGGMLVLVDALQRVGKDFDMEDFIKTMDSTDLDTEGLWGRLKFTATDHSSSKYVKTGICRDGEWVETSDWFKP